MRILVLLATLVVALPAAAQPADPSGDAEADSLVTLGAIAPAVALTAAEVSESLDARWQRAVYSIEAPVFSRTMHTVNTSADVVFLGAGPIVGAYALAEGDLRPAASLAATGLTTTGLVFALKALVQRPRPYAALDGVEADHGVPGSSPNAADTFDPHSFPSGHSALAFSIATSISLSYPEWYVIAPAFTWASLVALSRPWLGMHYPSDLAAGALIGGGVAIGAHLLVQALFPQDPGLPAGADPVGATPLMINVGVSF